MRTMWIGRVFLALSSGNDWWVGARVRRGRQGKVLAVGVAHWCVGVGWMSR